MKTTIQHKKIPITVLQGFLGAGKTTLLNYILTHNNGLNIGVVVNDFGDINIDSKLIKSKSEKQLELSSGCICCELKTLDLQEAIDQFTYQNSNIDYIIIEASGLAEPRDLALTLKDTLGVKVRLDSIVTVIDAENLEKNAKEFETARDQIIFTDFVIINKIDLVKPTKIKEIETMVRSFNPRARILQTTKGQLDIRLILDQDLYKTREIETSEHTDHSNHLHSRYESLSWSTTKPLDPMKFQEFVNRKIPTSIYRAKGIVDLGKKGHLRKYIFQLVGVRPEIVWENWHGDTPRTDLVFIGDSFNKTELENILNACIDKDPQSELESGIELKLPKKADF